MEPPKSFSGTGSWLLLSLRTAVHFWGGLHYLVKTVKCFSNIGIKVNKGGKSVVYSQAPITEANRISSCTRTFQRPCNEFFKIVRNFLRERSFFEIRN